MSAESAHLNFNSKTSTFYLFIDQEPFLRFLDKKLYLAFNRESGAFEIVTKKPERCVCECKVMIPKGTTNMTFIEISALAVALSNLKSGQFLKIYELYDKLIFNPYSKSGRLLGSFKVRDGTTPGALRRYAAEDLKERKLTFDALKEAGTKARAAIARMEQEGKSRKVRSLATTP